MKKYKNLFIIGSMVLGLLIHYGLYSYYGYDNIKSARKRRVKNGAEYYYGRLIEDNNFRPISGQSFTKEYHENNYGDMDYFDNIDQIIDDEDIVKDWVFFAKSVNASYVILTAKHNDGVCLWKTKTDSHCSEMNICKVFSDECKKENIDFGFYYSWFEFGKKFDVKYFNKYCIIHLRELMAFEPKHMWFYGDWKITQKTILQMIRAIVLQMKGSGCEVNDKVGKRDDYSFCSYRVFSERHIPEEKINIRWQHANTVGISWEYNSQQTINDYKTGRELVTLYRNIINLGGELLINIAPNAEGRIINEEHKAITFLGKRI